MFTAEVWSFQWYKGVFKLLGNEKSRDVSNFLITAGVVLFLSSVLKLMHEKNQVSLIFLQMFFFHHVLLFQKRRSNRQVKRKKYAEELEARMSDDEVKVIVKAKKANTAASKQPALQLFVVSSSVYTHLHHS